VNQATHAVGRTLGRCQKVSPMYPEWTLPLHQDTSPSDRPRARSIKGSTHRAASRRYLNDLPVLGSPIDCYYVIGESPQLKDMM
jgi:hypothetical protein